MSVRHFCFTRAVSETEYCTDRLYMRSVPFRSESSPSFLCMLASHVATVNWPVSCLVFSEVCDQPFRFVCLMPTETMFSTVCDQPFRFVMLDAHRNHV